jgi:hypothetical protein
VASCAAASDVLGSGVVGAPVAVSEILLGVAAGQGNDVTLSGAALASDGGLVGYWARASAVGSLSGKDGGGCVEVGVSA